MKILIAKNQTNFSQNYLCNYCLHPLFLKSQERSLCEWAKKKKLGDALLLLLLSRFSRVWLCVTPEMAAHEAPHCPWDSPGKNTSGLPFPSPMHESEKWKWSRSVVSDSSRPHGLQPTRFLCPWDFPSKSTGVGCHRLLRGDALFTCF